MQPTMRKNGQSLRQLWVVAGSTLKRWGAFRMFEQIKSQLTWLDVESSPKIHFVSHRWEQPDAPDPRNYQYQLLSTTLVLEDYYWYDYSCLPQKPSNETDQQYRSYVFENLNEIVQVAEDTIIMRWEQDNYFSRGWCFHEWFTAQFIGKGQQRLFPGSSQMNAFGGMPRSQMDEIVQAKRAADQVLCGDFSHLRNLDFTRESDRPIVSGLTRAAVALCQRKIASTGLEMLNEVIAESAGSLSAQIMTPEDMHLRFLEIVKFIKVWTWALQPVEPVSDRVAMFFHKQHWDALIRISGPIVFDLARLEYGTEMRSEETTAVNRQLRDIYDYCQRRMPDARYEVVALLCFFLMGYDVQ